MAQTMYNRPFPAWVPLPVGLVMIAMLIGVALTKGFGSPAMFIALSIELIVMGILTVLDPEFTFESRKALPNGREVTVRRPLVGFKRHERQVGVTGGYEVRVDGYRYEAAYIRI
ncbi:hypothetical protein GQ53DRAFT_516920 [Thozetella sp. PMI_491]|nr:hypothetical protein GQ53DRAFT_516920 [Thozetella sp. PMI_491]